jgi:transcriptional regulator with XRE-family HTH domain
MGELIRKARLESSMSQADLAEKAHFRQAAISQIETGKREVSSVELLYLSHALNKPITYFFPEWCMVEKSDDESLSPLEKELLLQVNRLDDDEDLRRLIALARGLVNFAENKPFDDEVE